MRGAVRTRFDAKGPIGRCVPGRGWWHGRAAKPKRDPSLHRPTRSQEANAEEKASACFAQDDGAAQAPACSAQDDGAAKASACVAQEANAEEKASACSAQDDGAAKASACSAQDDGLA